jgi:molecular chaperone GrpE (heat shock protein)
MEKRILNDPLSIAEEILITDNVQRLTQRDIESARTFALVAIARSLREIASAFTHTITVPAGEDA